MVHGFFRWRGGVDAAHEAMEEAAAALRDALGSRRASRRFPAAGLRQMKRPACAGRFGEERYCYVGLLYVICEGSL